MLQIIYKHWIKGTDNSTLRQFTLSKRNQTSYISIIPTHRSASLRFYCYHFYSWLQIYTDSSLWRSTIHDTAIISSRLNWYKPAYSCETVIITPRFLGLIAIVSNRTEALAKSLRGKLRFKVQLGSKVETMLQRANDFNVVNFIPQIEGTLERTGQDIWRHDYFLKM